MEFVMKLVRLSLVAVSLLTLPAATFATDSVSIPTNQLKYGSTGVTDNVHGEVKAAAAYGDFSQGAHGTFLRLPGGFASPAHSHSNDEWGVIVAGVAANGKPGAPDVLLPVGSYFFQKAGETHITKCVSENECVILLSQPGKYDFIPTK
jgi:beta-alanine degradation protein BauB